MTEPLWSTINTPEVEHDVTAAANDKFDEAEDILVFYEHGQWFVEVDDGETFANYSVVTCQRENGEEYLDFEEL